MPAIPALVHPDEDVREWFQDVVVPGLETWLAERDGQLIGLMVLNGDELDQLYVHPASLRRGLGGGLLRLAQRRRPNGLSLWTFQSNVGAQRFYERHGFVAVERTDGGTNEERAPDIRYAWRPPQRT